MSTTEKLAQALMACRETLKAYDLEGTWADTEAEEALAAHEADKQAGRASAQAVPAWQPIETAPKDGTGILVSAAGFCHAVEWQEEFDWWAVDDNKLGPFRLRGAAPTHWMHLPAAPKGD
jgi:hypothetical protein